MKTSAILRAALAVVGGSILFATWWNAHWSVALSLTLLFARAEISHYLKDRDRNEQGPTQ